MLSASGFAVPESMVVEEEVMISVAPLPSLAVWYTLTVTLTVALEGVSCAKTL